MRSENDFHGIGIDESEFQQMENESRASYDARIQERIHETASAPGEHVGIRPFNRKTKMPIRKSFLCPEINSKIHFLDTVGACDKVLFWTNIWYVLRKLYGVDCLLVWAAWMFFWFLILNVSKIVHVKVEMFS